MNSISYQAIFNEKPCFKQLEKILKESVEEYDESVEFNINIKYCKKIDYKKFLMGFDVILGSEDVEIIEEDNLIEDYGDEGDIETGIKFLDTPAEFETEDELDLIIDSFNDNLESDAEVIFKFSDDNLFEKLSLFYREIFETEMKLREVLTFIFVDKYKENFYNLLHEIKMGDNHTVISDEEKEDLPQKFENEFFHMSFSTYKKMSKTEDKISIIDDLIPVIDKNENIDELKEKITNRGITKNKYKDFLAEIDEHLNNLQILRNCVAHNRTPTDEEIRNYKISSKKLNIAIKNFWKQCPKIIA